MARAGKRLNTGPKAAISKHSPRPARPDVVILPAPDHLGGAGTDFWIRVHHDYDLHDDPGELKILQTACECVDRLREAQEHIAEHGALILDRFDQWKRNPASNVEADARAGLLGALRQLGLDPDITE